SQTGRLVDPLAYDSQGRLAWPGYHLGVWIPGRPLVQLYTLGGPTCGLGTLGGCTGGRARGSVFLVWRLVGPEQAGWGGARTRTYVAAIVGLWRDDHHAGLHSHQRGVYLSGAP